MSENIEVVCITTGLMGNNSWLVKNKETGEGFLVDASFNGKLISEKIKKEGVKLKGIMITHCHYDHIYSVNELREVFAENSIKVYAGEDEKDNLKDPSFNLIRKHNLPLEGVVADVYLKDNEYVTIAGINVKTVFTPGHTKGGVCYLIESGNLLFSGDTLFEGSYGRTDLPSGNENELVRSITGKLFTMPMETKVFPGHGETTDIGYESRTNPVLKLLF